MSNNSFSNEEAISFGDTLLDIRLSNLCFSFARACLNFICPSSSHINEFICFSLLAFCLSIMLGLAFILQKIGQWSLSVVKSRTLNCSISLYYLFDTIP